MRLIAIAASILGYGSSVLGAGTGAVTQAEADRVEDRGHLPAERPERHLVLMPVVGIWNHPFERSGWTAKPGPVWGLDLKIEPFPWLNARASVLRGNQPVAIASGALKRHTEVYQPTVETTRLGLRVEPTLQLANRLSGYVGLGISWGRFIAPEAVAVPRLHTLRRSGVYVGYEGALGIAYEPRVDWVVLDLSLAGSLLTKQTGTAYESVQAFTDAGHRTTLGALSHFSGTYRIMFGIGFVL